MELKNEMLVTQSCPVLCNPMDCSPPGSSVHGVLQARTLDCVAIPFSKGSSLPRSQTQVACTASRFFTNWAIREALGVLEEIPSVSSWPQTYGNRIVEDSTCRNLHFIVSPIPMCAPWRISIIKRDSIPGQICSQSYLETITFSATKQVAYDTVKFLALAMCLCMCPTWF